MIKKRVFKHINLKQHALYVLSLILKFWFMALQVMFYKSGVWDSFSGTRAAQARERSSWNPTCMLQRSHLSIPAGIFSTRNPLVHLTPFDHHHCVTVASVMRHTTARCLCAIHSRLEPFSCDISHVGTPSWHGMALQPGWHCRTTHMPDWTMWWYML